MCFCFSFSSKNVCTISKNDDGLSECTQWPEPSIWRTWALGNSLSISGKSTWLKNKSKIYVKMFVHNVPVHYYNIQVLESWTLINKFHISFASQGLWRKFEL